MTKARVYNSEIIKELLAITSPEEFAKTEKKMLLAARIADAIKDRGWHKKDFALALNKRPSEISKWLSGIHNFTADTLFDIEQVLNIHLFRLESKPDIVYKTYFFSATNITSESHQQNWLSILNQKFSKSSYKAISSINT